MNRREALRVAAGVVAATVAGSSAWAQGRPPGPPGGRPPERVPGNAAPMPTVPPTAVRILDVHAHLFTARDYDIGNSVQPALRVMDQLGIAKALIMPPPGEPGHPNLYDYERILPVIGPYRDRFGFLGGGGTLNPLIHRYGPEKAVTEATRREFEATAERILAAGAVGFGEIAAHHISYYPQHPYESTPADGPLLRLLADIAARHDVPIDLHMDPVPSEMALPAQFGQQSTKNPPTAKENITSLERLLSHNRAARIVWAHAGRDSLGTWTVDLSRTLLGRHPNLYMSLSLHPPFGLVPENSLLDAARQPNQRWISLIADLPDRFLIGTDFFHMGADRAGLPLPPPTPLIRRFLDALPPALAARIAHENAARIYRVSLS